MSKKTSEYYLFRLYRENRYLFWVVCLIGILHLNANFFFGGQQSPFFRWDLYAHAIKAQDTFYFYEVRYNGNQVLKFPYTREQPLELFYTNTLNQYVIMRENDGDAPMRDYIERWNHRHPVFASIFPGLKFYPDSAEMRLFPDWYVRKISYLTGDTVHTMDIYRINLAFDRDNRVRLLSADLLYKLR